MEKLWQQWADADPVGMLEFLEHKRVWPENCRAYVDLNFSRRPDLSLDFALRYGCSDIIRRCGSYGDPVTVAGLLAALPEEQRGSEIIEAQQAIDRRLGALGAGMANPSPAYLRGAAEALLEEGRIDEFFDTFEKVEDPSERKQLAAKLGEALSDEQPGDEVLAQVLRLPEPYQEEAAYKLMGYGGSCAMEFPEVRESRKRWIERVAAEGFVEAAAHGVDDLFDDQDAARRGEEWATWVASFPPDDSWKPITKAIFRGWQQHDREEMIRQICALPEGSVRETLAVEAAAATIGGLAQAFDDEQQVIYDRLADLFTEPEANRRFEKRFGPSEDPFASEDDHDPFADGDE